jgi:hypothetical protein
MKIWFSMEQLTANTYSNVFRKINEFFYELKTYYKIVGFESSIWIFGLIYLAFFSPVDHTHFTFCPLANLGITFCPGCGLGHSITQIFHGKFIESFHTHPLGLFALIVILFRIYTLIKTNINNYKKAKA